MAESPGGQLIHPQRFPAFICRADGCSASEAFADWCPLGHGRLTPATLIPLDHVVAVARALGVDDDVLYRNRPPKTEFESGVMSLLEEL